MAARTRVSGVGSFTVERLCDILFVCAFAENNESDRYIPSLRVYSESRTPMVLAIINLFTSPENDTPDNCWRFGSLRPSAIILAEDPRSSSCLKCTFSLRLPMESYLHTLLTVL